MEGPEKKNLQFSEEKNYFPAYDCAGYLCLS
jgi:hypothetical protein